MIDQYKLLYQYMYHEEQALENDVIQLDQNIYYRDADYIDHLEMILAKMRLEASQKIFSDIRLILRIMREIEE